MPRTASLPLCLAGLVLLFSATSLRADDDVKPAVQPWEKQAVRAIEKLGGRITYGKLVDGEFEYDVVVGVSLLDSKVTDAGLKELARLKRLQTLNLINTPKITDAGVQALRKALPGCAISR